MPSPLEAILNFKYFITNLKFLLFSKKLYSRIKISTEFNLFSLKNYTKRLHILYTQSIRTTHATHVLPRLLAHVLAIASSQFQTLFKTTDRLYSFVKKPSSSPLICWVIRQYIAQNSSLLPAVGLFSYPMWLIDL